MNRLLYQLSYAAILVPLNFGAPKLNKKYYSRKNGNVKHKNGECDIFCSWIHCRGRRLRRPSGKTFRFYSAFGEFETFSNGTSRAPSPTGGTRTACVVSGLTSVHIPGGMRPEARGISHGLKKCPPDTFSPRRCRGRPFDSHTNHLQKKKATCLSKSLFLLW